MTYLQQRLFPQTDLTGNVSDRALGLTARDVIGERSRRAAQATSGGGPSSTGAAPKLSTGTRLRAALQRIRRAAELTDYDHLSLYQVSERARAPSPPLARV